MGIVLRSDDEIARIGRTGAIVARVLDAIEAACAPGVTTAALDAIAMRALRRAGATSVYLGYRPPRVTDPLGAAQGRAERAIAVTPAGPRVLTSITSRT